MAGDNGPERNELEMPAEENDHAYDGSDGEVMDASGGSIGFGVSPSFSFSELLRECPFPFEFCVGDFLSDDGEAALTVLAPSLLSGTLLPVAAALSDDSEDEERDVRDETEKDCSKGFGSKSKLFRNGGRASAWELALFADEDGCFVVVPAVAEDVEDDEEAWTEEGLR